MLSATIRTFKRGSRFPVVVMYLGALFMVGCTARPSQQSGGVRALETALMDVNNVRVRYSRNDQRELPEEDVKRCKAAFNEKNIEIVPNASRIIKRGDLEMLHDSVERANVGCYEGGIYCYEGVYFRLRDDDISAMVELLHSE